MRVAVIGGGPSGLTTLKHLLTAHQFFEGIEPIAAKLFEAEDSIGGTFKYKSYEDAELVSPKQLTMFSDHRFIQECFGYFSTEQYRDSLEDYAVKFRLFPHIHFQTLVTKLERTGSGHTVSYVERGRPSQWKCDAVAVCSGLQTTPNIPDIQGLDRVPVVLHSSSFKEREQFGVDKNVLIVGSGETGIDLAYLAIMARTKSVTLCNRDGFVSAPKRALDLSIFHQPLFNTKAKVIPYIEAQNRAIWLVDKIRSCVSRVANGDRCRKIDLATWPKEIDHKGRVLFVENRRNAVAKLYRPDVVVLATGYTQSSPFLDQTYPRPQHANIRSIWKEEDGSVGFIGFVRPDSGSIGPLVELQAQVWIARLLDRLPAPLKPEDNYLSAPRPSSRIQYGVKNEAYALQLALDMGALPAWSDFFTKGWELTLAWGLSAQFNTKFRFASP